jgi:teichuronic acid biosynthesis glycosyltransferase TuaC
MRVLVITTDFPAPGQPFSGIFVIRQIQALAELGYEILVVRIVPYAPALTSKWRAYCSIPDDYVIEGIEVHTIRAFQAPRMLGMEFLPFQVGAAFRRIIREFAPRVVHAHYLIPSGHIAAHQPVPVVLTAHGSDAYDWAWRRSGLRRAAVKGISRAKAVVAVSDFIRERVRALVDREVAVIYNGADERIFAPTSAQEARRALGIDAGRFVITHAGRLSRTKGTLDLLEAAGRISRFDPLLLLAGPETTDAKVQDALRKAGVESRLFGMVSHRELARLLGASDVFCLPSYREGLPVVVCEAMLSARPVVASIVGGIPEIVSDGDRGYLVRPGDVPLLAQRLADLAADREKARRMGERAYEFAREHLTWRTNAAAYDRIYRRIGDAPS